MGKLGKRKRNQERLIYAPVFKVQKTGDEVDVSLVQEDADDVIHPDDLIATLSVLETIATKPNLLKSKSLKPLRSALHAINKANGSDGGLTNQVTSALADRRWTDARVVLAEMEIRKRVPKLGALQRWVRECDAATVQKETWDAEVYQVLEAILRTTKHQSADSDDRQPTLKKQAAWEIAPEQASTFKSAFHLVQSTPGRDRKPPNHYEALLYTSRPNALPFTSGNIVKHTAPFLPSVFLLTDVLTSDLCRSIIAAASTIGFTPDQPIGAQHSTLAQNFYWLADTTFLTTLFNLTKPHLPQSYPDGATLYGINARFRCYRYVPGEVYRPHIDGAWPPSAISDRGDYIYDASPPGYAVMSRLTFLIYLNDEFEAGETTFYKAANGGGLELWPVKPRCGAVLVFPHGDGGGGGLIHEGSEVTKGGKFIIRTDVLYATKIA